MTYIYIYYICGAISLRQKRYILKLLDFFYPLLVMYHIFTNKYLNVTIRRTNKKTFINNYLLNLNSSHQSPHITLHCLYKFVISI